MKIDDEDARDDLLIYATEQFPDHERIRFLDDEFSAEIIALELKVPGVIQYPTRAASFKRVLLGGMPLIL